MANRKHSIKVPVNYGNVADSLTGSLVGTPVIFIPENSVSNPVNFNSVLLYLAAQDSASVTGANLVTLTSSVNLSGSATSSVPVAALPVNVLSHSGENWGGLIGPIDYTSYFSNSFGTLTSKTASVNITASLSTGSLRAVYGYFDITYTYDDSAASRIKTICVPYQCNTGSLTATAARTYCTMSALTGSGGLLTGYNAPNVRYRWIEIKGNCNCANASTIFGLSCSFDASASSVQLPRRVAALGSDTWQLFQVDASGIGYDITHSFNLYSTLANRWFNLVVNEWITYEYVVAGTTQVLNYIEIPINYNSPLVGPTSASFDRYQKTFTIPEPATITLKKAAVELNYNTNNSSSILVKSGNQNYVNYTQTSSVVAGQFSLQHGLDVDSLSGSALNLIRGANTVNIDVYRASGSAYNTNGIVKLLYSSGVNTASIDSYSDTRWSLIRPMSFISGSEILVTGSSYSIPETNFWIHGIDMQQYYWLSTQFNAFSYQGTVNTSESKGGGWTTFFEDEYVGEVNGELAFCNQHIPVESYFKQYARDSSNLLILSSSRSIKSTSTNPYQFGAAMGVSYYTLTFDISGSISGTNGNTVRLDLYQISGSAAPKLIDTTTRIGNGTYSFSTYDDTLNYYVVAYESASFKGVSKLSTPATNFDIQLSSTGSGGEFFF